jgi:hypothetical protein
MKQCPQHTDMAVALRRDNTTLPDHIFMGCVMFSFMFHRLGISFRFDIGNEAA